MRKFTADELALAVGGKLVHGSGTAEINGISTDSRTSGKEDVFFPLIGEKNDAHDFLEQAAKNGTRTVIVSKPEKLPESWLGSGSEMNIITVDDTNEALKRLAGYYLDSLDLKHRIAVTGSVGKTSTRDLLYYVLSEKYKTGRNVKNFNNGFGLPQSILAFPPDTEAAILEMGMSTAGSIEALADFTRPDMAVITNIGISHIENFPDDGREGILKTKLAVTKYFGKDSVLAVNGDNDMLTPDRISGGYNVISVSSGNAERAGYVISDVQDGGDSGVTFTLEGAGERRKIHIPVAGAHNAMNASLAIAIGGVLGIDMKTAAEGLEKAELTGNRLRFVKAGGIKIIDDSYNASPDSMKGGINTLMATSPDCEKSSFRRVAVLGDMYELGKNSREEHFKVGEYAVNAGCDAVIAIGKNGAEIAAGALSAKSSGEKKCEIKHFETRGEVIELADELFTDGDIILVKASNSMKLGVIVKKIAERRESNE